MLFQGWSSAKGWYGGRPWLGHPYHPDNNIQKFNGNLKSDVGPDLGDPRVRKHQAAYLRKVVDTVNDLDNVLFEVTNEGGTKDWDWWVVRTVQEYEKTKPKQHPVGLTGHGSETNEEMLASPAAWFSPGSRRLAGPADRSPARSGHEGQPVGHRPRIRSGRRSEMGLEGFYAGHNVLFMDPYDDPQWTPILDRPEASACADAEAPGGPWASPGAAPSGWTWPPRRRSPSWRPPAICLANPGREYLVYLPDGGEVQLDLTKAPGKFAVEWMHAISGKTTPAAR